MGFRVWVFAGHDHGNDFCCTLHGTAHLSRSATQVVAGEGFGFTIQYEAKNLCYMFFAGTGRRVAILLFKSCVV